MEFDGALGKGRQESGVKADVLPVPLCCVECWCWTVFWGETVPCYVNYYRWPCPVHEETFRRCLSFPGQEPGGHRSCELSDWGCGAGGKLRPSCGGSVGAGHLADVLALPHLSR